MPTAASSRPPASGPRPPLRPWQSHGDGSIILITVKACFFLKLINSRHLFGKHKSFVGNYVLMKSYLNSMRKFQKRMILRNRANQYYTSRTKMFNHSIIKIHKKLKIFSFVTYLPKYLGFVFNMSNNILVIVNIRAQPRLPPPRHPAGRQSPPARHSPTPLFNIPIVNCCKFNSVTKQQNIEKTHHCTVYSLLVFQRVGNSISSNSVRDSALS